MVTEKIIKMATERGEFLPLEDGFCYYAPNGCGGISADDLRKLADHLDEINKPHEEAMAKYFENNP